MLVYCDSGIVSRSLLITASESSPSLAAALDMDKVRAEIAAHESGDASK